MNALGHHAQHHDHARQQENNRFQLLPGVKKQQPIPVIAGGMQPIVFCSVFPVPHVGGPNEKNGQDDSANNVHSAIVVTAI